MTTTTTKPASGERPNRSSTVSRQLADAHHALAAGQPASAARVLQQALALAPDDAEVLRLMGVASLMTGDRREALTCLQRARALAPDDAAVAMTLGSALFETGAVEDGLAQLQRACDLAPTDAQVWYNLGAALEFACFSLQRIDHMTQARDAFEHALVIDAGHINARNKLATALVTLGEMSAAAAELRETLRRQPDCVDAWIALRNLKTERMSRTDAAQLRELVERPALPAESRTGLAFTLAKALEDTSDYAAAFDALRRANALQRRQVPWSRSDERARVDAVAQAFAQPLAGASDASLGEGIIFVVCLPRSGATLTEQILASHPEVQAGGETGLLIDILREETDRVGQASLDWMATATAADWQRLGERYLGQAGALCDSHPRFTDKSVDNWAYVGAALAMLPGARVVNCRRDPVENCFACFRQLFPVGGEFTYDLDDMVDYYAGYERLCALWRRQISQRWLDFDYEALQDDTERQIRRLLEFCELPFDPACLEFHRARRVVLTMSSSQVREPVRRDTARSPLYGSKLDPLRAALRAAGIAPTRTRADTCGTSSV